MNAPPPPTRTTFDSPPQGARALFRRLREIMARETEAQERLDQFAKVIAANLVAEVSAIYLRREGDVLELFAAEGLNAEAVHRTQLEWGEGIVGSVAEAAQPVNLADARRDERFAYRPETGEDPFRSFLGVPILRGGRVLGVLTIQNKAARLYTEEELEALQTTAMVLGEIAASGELVDSVKFHDVEEVLHRPERFQGVGFAEGVGMGYAHFHEPPVGAADLFTDDVASEEERLVRAVGELRSSVDKMLEAPDIAAMGAPREVLEAYRLFAYDRGWLDRLRAAVLSGLTAEAAVEQVKTENRVRMAQARDPYLRDRMHDLDDLAHRLLRHLGGASDARQVPPDDAVLFARSLGPAELLEYDRSKLRGVVLGEGSAASHVAIVARAIGVPLVGRAGDALEDTDPGDAVIVDGSAGVIVIRPTEDVAAAYRSKLELASERQKTYARRRDEPSVSKDGQAVSLRMNAGLRVDLPHVKATGAEGIGLFRTELQFMIAPGLPKLAAQTAFYKEIFDACGDRPITFRTVDLGGEKVLPYVRHEREANPAMGWRAIRLALDRPGLLRYQLRALLEAADGRDLNVMFPMIATVDEFHQARALLDKEVKRRVAKGAPVSQSLRVGAMIEVPSIAFEVESLLPHADFMAIGGNDLAQFFFAADRDNARVQKRYDILHTAFLSLIRSIVQKADAAQTPVTYCGEQAARPLEALALMGAGLRAFSLPATAIGPVKELVGGVDLGVATDAFDRLLAEPRGGVRADVESVARDLGVKL